MFTLSERLMAMLRIIIIDDEETIRIGLEKIITKARADYSVVGTFSNGRDALAELARLEPDVVITDIKMPYMDGLQFIQALKEQRPLVRCIILSGYNDFDYARRSLHFGVTDYLIKPVDKQELFINLDHITEAIVRERLESEREMLQDHKAKRNDYLEQEIVLRKRMLGELPTVEMDASDKEEMEDKQQNLLEETYVVLAMRVSDKLMCEYLLAQFRIGKLKECAITSMGEQAMAVLLSINSNEDPYTQVQRFCSKLTREVRSQGDPEQIGIGVSQFFQSKEQLQHAYSEALQAVHYNIYRLDTAYFSFFKDVKHKTLDLALMTNLLDQELTQALELSNREAVRFSMQLIFKELEHIKPTYEEVVRVLSNIFYVACMRCDGLSNEIAQLTKPDFNIYDSVKQYLTLKQMCKWLLDLLDDALKNLEEKRLGSGSRVIETVKQMLHAQYNQEIELTELSDMVFLNASYLSFLFKQETGQTITQYLLEIRMMKAKELLRARMDLKVYQIGELVGYADAMYFNKLFKKTIGITPKDFRSR
ncbi:response regulator [Paenibacillus psychroresistens]|uniref:Response regulator n=1 Tax=Paenibacillus psychroresistens TaxID=1778678 RepID=A0A6B8RPS4_9BACL|nr:response regulator [Paenibacillus psychroresistens]QGQ98360.1 response regulator [Paenibacillus psychroresistens]